MTTNVQDQAAHVLNHLRDGNHDALSRSAPFLGTASTTVALALWETLAGLVGPDAAYAPVSAAVSGDEAAARAAGARLAAAVAVHLKPSAAAGRPSKKGRRR